VTALLLRVLGRPGYPAVCPEGALLHRTVAFEVRGGSSRNTVSKIFTV
jgi:hypothetical protein